MKKHGMLNSHISRVLSDLGHTDIIVIADLGLPIPAGVPKIDLALKLGTPGFQEVVDLVAEDMVIEKVILAAEIREENPAAMQYITGKFGNDAVNASISHEQFKALTRHAKAVIRTGEATPYANCILQAGVNFG
ncbi:D-ribose pyranase [Paenibacillus sp. P96]|uniref:D-ribose pyranase n=1 Tax=Paenibacillus zeirhizosphaerae TaxID=2987519 RepID=A0ABT9FVX2_9BACL|nr:D-ribose pyranase [Paenibacillus sp. P96]MDP4098681.1 D-ribose pyranase [Paenibacillus sp. P96]